MSFEPRDNTGALFKNEDRQKDTHAHARGSAVIDGVHYFVDAWTKPGKDGGSKWQSLSFKRKDKQPGTRAQAKPYDPPAYDPADASSDIPF